MLEGGAAWRSAAIAQNRLLTEIGSRSSVKLGQLSTALLNPRQQTPRLSATVSAHPDFPSPLAPDQIGGEVRISTAHKETALGQTRRTSFSRKRLFLPPTFCRLSADSRHSRREMA